MLIAIEILVVLLLLAVAAVTVAIRARKLQYWLGAYLREHRGYRRQLPAGSTVYVCVADHYEPYAGGKDRELAHRRVAAWMQKYPLIAAQHRDSEGRHPLHSFFYPLEEYDPALLDQLADLTRRRLGDVEVHYHHDNDTAAGLRTALDGFATTLRQRHGLLRDGPDGKPAWCFIHGNWALDNSRPDGRWCGVDNELQVLVDAGCQVDYTMPSAPSDTQTRIINSIYLSRGRPGQRKSHDHGRRLAVGTKIEPGELLLIQGPLGFNFSARKLGLIPRIENGEISADCPPTPERVRLWLQYAPCVVGAEKHVFLKLHTHGAVDDTSMALLDGGLQTMWSALEAQIRDRPGCRLRYVSAWEMQQIVRSLAAGARA